MHTNYDYKQWLNKVTKSKYFTSGNDVRLLEYLINATLDKKNLKETIIAIDIFDRDSSFDPGSDSIVRSNIYNLRKKLQTYYQNEGDEDLIRFEIPKGSYHVKFITGSKKPGESKNWIPVVVSATLAVTTLIFAFLYFFDGKFLSMERKSVDNPVWSYYMNSENPLMIVLGDYFMMEKIQLPDSSYNFIRDPEINNQNDFSGYLENYPELRKSVKKLGQSYFGEEIPQCFNLLLDIFRTQGKEVQMKYASALSLNDLRENDIIFVGDFATLGILKPFFENTGIRYSNIPSSLYILDEQQDTTEFLLLDNPASSVFQNDYAMVSTISGYENKRIMFFLSFLPFGKLEALYKLAEPTFLDEISLITTPLPENWNLLMKVSGLQSSGFYYEVIRFDPHE